MKLAISLALQAVGLFGSEPDDRGDAAGPDQTACAPPSPDVRPRIDLIVLRVEGASVDALAAALAPRLDDRRISTEDAEELGDELSYAYVDVHPADEGYVVTLAVSDGRTFSRRVEVEDPELVERELASHITILVQGVEDGSAAPDSVSPAPREERPASRKRRRWFTTMVADPPATGELLVKVSLAGSTGIAAPRDARASLAAYGSIGTDYILANKAVVTVDVRLGGTGQRFMSDRFHLLRVRVGAGGGYRFAHAGFEIPVVAMFTVEPWTILRASRRVDLEDGAGADARYLPLVGGTVRVAAMRRLRVSTRRSAWQIGGVFELSLSSAANRETGATRVALSPSSSPAFRLGGVEVMVGLAAAWGTAVRKRR